MSLHTLHNAFHAPGILRTLIRNVKRQKKFIAENLSAELTIAKEASDHTLDESDFKKITGYYGLAVPAILGEALCVLRGYPMTIKERTACTYQGAMTGLFDDFFDKHDMPDDLLKKFIETPEQLTGNNSGEKLFLEFYRKARQHFCDADLTLKYLRKVYEAQVESKKQSAPGLSKEEIKRITINKGGVSVLFYRTVFENPLSPEEETALYQIGGLMQFGNDIFDVYKDSLKNIETLVTTTEKINEVRNEFREMAETSFNAFYKTQYPKKNIRKFLRLVSMSLCGRCYVCLDQLEEKEKLTDNRFSPKQYGRNDLVCDMDKAGNKWRSVLYHIKQHVQEKV